MANRKEGSIRRRRRVRRHIRDKARGRVRLTVFRSGKNMYAQIIDDNQGQTLVSASTTEKDLRGSTGGNVDAARRVGKAIAERALAKGIGHVVFDRGGYLYHGRVKALTDAARDSGLNKDESAEPEEEQSKE